MKRVIKGLICIALCAFVALSLSTCVAKPKTTATTPTPAEAPTPTLAPTQEPTPESAPEPTPETIPDLSGEWKQTNSHADDSYQIAKIESNLIEVYWVFPDQKAIYWSGTFTPPTNVGDYSWMSVRDKEKTDYAIFSASAEKKEFVYSSAKDELSFEVEAFGTISTIRMGRN